MKTTARILLRILTPLVLLAAVASAIWWDHNQPDHLFLTGGKTPRAQHVEVGDAPAVLTCPGKPVLASLGEDAATPGVGENGKDGEGADDDENEAPVGTFDPDYAPDAGDAQSQLRALSLETEDAPPALGILRPLQTAQDEQDEQAGTEEVELKGSGAVLNGEITADEAVTFTAQPHPDHRQEPLVAGLRFGGAMEGDLRGLAATSCIPVGAEHWLIGGQTEAGSSAKLELMNPSDTAATARLELWGAAGPIEPAGTSSILIPPGEHRSVLLEGLAPKERRIAVRVQASGARIGAVIQDVRTLGLNPAGVGYIAPSAPLATTAVVPGIAIGDDGASALRILIPGVEPGLIDISLVDENGAVVAADLAEQRVAGNSVTDISLRGIPTGIYSAIIESDVPMAASGFAATRPDDEQRDIAWAPTAKANEQHVFSLPNIEMAMEQKLAVAGVDEAARVNISFITGAGEVKKATEISVAPGESRVVDVPRLEESGQIVGVVIVADEPVVSGMVLRSSEIASDGLAMLPATPRSVLPSGREVLFQR